MLLLVRAPLARVIRIILRTVCCFRFCFSIWLGWGTRLGVDAVAVLTQGLTLSCVSLAVLGLLLLCRLFQELVFHLRQPSLASLLFLLLLLLLFSLLLLLLLLLLQGFVRLVSICILLPLCPQPLVLFLRLPISISPTPSGPLLEYFLAC